MKEFYNMKNIFFLPEEARWTHIIENAKQDDIALKIDTALHTKPLSFEYNFLYPRILITILAIFIGVVSPGQRHFILSK